MEEKKPDTEVQEQASVSELTEEEIESIALKKESKFKGLIQFVWFILMSLIAFALQMLIAQFGDDLLELCGVDNTEMFLEVGLDKLTLAGFIAFLVANVVAKVISYILNRKKTFAAVNNLAFSFSVYVVMCVALIVAETFIAAPIQGMWIKVGVPEDVAGMVTVITYSIPDFLIVFLLEKFVIMNNKLFAKKKDEDEVAVAADESAEAPAVEAPVEEVAASDAVEAPVEEAVATEAVEAPVEEVSASEEAAEAEAVEEVAEAVEVATPVEEVVTEEPLAETAAEEEAVEQAEQTASDEAPAEIVEAPVEEAASEQTEVVEAPVEEAVVEEQAPAEEAPVAEQTEAPVEEVAAAPAEEKPAKKAPAKKAAAKKTDDKKPAAKKPAAKKADDKKAPAKKAPAKKADAKEEKESAPSNVTVLFEEPETDSPKGKFVVIKDDLNPDRPYKFQLKANNGQVLYESESFKIKPRAKQIEVFRNTINNGTSTIDSEKNGTFRYKLFKADGTLYGVGEGYKTRASAESALESVKNFCNTSNVLEDTTVD